MKINDVLNEFIKEQVVRGSTDATILHYKKHIGFFVKYFGNLDVSCINYNVYQDYIIYLKNKNKESGVKKGDVKKLSGRTVKTYASALKTFLSFCYLNNFISVDIAQQIKMPKYKKKNIIILNKQQINSLIYSQNQFCFTGIRNLLIISLMLDCGLRLIEVTRLRLCDIFINEGLINADGKGQKERLVPMSETTQHYFRIYIDSVKKLLNRSLFPAEILLKKTNGNDITKNSIVLVFKRLQKKLGFNVHPHLLRHTFATMFLLNGGDVMHLQAILGHTTLNMVLNYVHLANQLSLSDQAKYSPLSNL